ncbi:MAG TPA: hypothetical protein VGF68_07590 [Solirubrobacteraceae bacterium]|jgi:hypothetical protein
MGLLDDAIRDHLDLKRRRGADPSEVEHAEREALGPVRRNPTPSELAEAEAAAAPEGAPAYDQAGEEGWSHDSLQEPAADAGQFEEPAADNGGFEEPAADAGVYQQPVPPPEFPGADAAPVRDRDEAPPAEPAGREAPSGDEPFDEDEPFFDGDEPAHEPLTAERDQGAPPPMGGAGPETAEYNVEDALAAEEDRHDGGNGDDVLEETPEFLQDTPDHDRLWFEQRPPKDFDFDE